MEIQLLVSIDGEQLPLNEELGSTISGLVNAYVKQKITGEIPKQRKVKNPNAPKREARKGVTEEEIARIVQRGQELASTGISRNKTSLIISQEISRSLPTVYRILQEKAIQFSPASTDNLVERFNKADSLRNVFKK